MKLNQFRYLAAIAEHGSIAKAARSLFISQPSVSQAIKELEDEIQKLTDKYIKEIDKAVEVKSKEIMTV